MTENTDMNDKIALAAGVWGWIRLRFCTREVGAFDSGRLANDREGKLPVQTALDPPKPPPPPPRRRRHPQATTFLEMP